MKEIIEAFYSRVRSPVFGYFAIAWIALNWKELAVLVFSDEKIKDRVFAFDSMANYYTLLLYPLLIGVFAAIVSPRISYLFLKICVKPTNLKNALQADTEHAHLLKKLQLEEIRNQIQNKKERELIDQAKRDVEINQIENEQIKNNLQNQIDSLRKDVSKNKSESVPGMHKELEESARFSVAKELAEMYRRDGRPEEAEKILRKVLNKDITTDVLI